MNSGTRDTASGKRSTAVCVIGPGRSGTSMTMRVLNLLGVYVGREEALVGPGPGGPKGFWERLDMIEIDDRLLRLQGGSWRNPPRLQPGWEGAEELARERARARALIETTFAGHELWGWKNPRVSLTTAFWRSLVPDLRFVICLRNPIDLVASMSPPVQRGRDDAFYYSRRSPKGERAHRLWLTYVAAALANTAGLPRLLVSFDDHFDNRRATVERLARFVGREPPPIGSDADLRLEEFVDAGLRHHRTPPAEVLSDDRLPPEVASLYLATELLRAVGPAGGEHTDSGYEALQTGVDAYARRLLAAGGGQPERAAALESPSLNR